MNEWTERGTVYLTYFPLHYAWPALHPLVNYTASQLLHCKCRLQISDHINLLKSTGHVMHQQFNIQQLYVLPTLYLCVLYLSENKQLLVPLTA